MPEFCNVERDGKVTTVTINRPKVMNALHPAANRELGEVFDDFCADPAQWIAIITGAALIATVFMGRLLPRRASIDIMERSTRSLV